MCMVHPSTHTTHTTHKNNHGVPLDGTAALRIATRMPSPVAASAPAAGGGGGVEGPGPPWVPVLLAPLTGTRPTQSGMGMPNHVLPWAGGDGVGGLGEGAGGLGDDGAAGVPMDAATLMMPCVVGGVVGY